MKVGIIGFGRLGKLVATNLAKDFDLFVFDPQAKQEDIQSIGATYCALKDICQCPIIIPIVPISELEQLLKVMAPQLKQEQHLIIDVCSVKVKPCQWMQDHLPEHVSILGAHPMFGPDSAKKSLYGHKIVLCPIRVHEKQQESIHGYLESHGLKVITTTPDDHDKQVASSLLLTHFVGRTLIDFGATNLTIDTKGYRRLMKILETVENDTWQLFVDMNRYNPHAEKLRKQFINCMKAVNDKL